MALTTFEIETTSLLISKHCRLDIKYYNFTAIRNWKSFDTKFNYIKLSDILEELPIIKFKKGELTEEYYMVNISDQEQRSGDLEKVELTNTLGSDKNYLGDADVFISKLGMPRGYIFINTFKGEKVLGSTEFIPYKIKKDFPKLLLKYILLNPVLIKVYSALETGKTPSHKRVNPYEFLKIKIPKIPIPIQDKAVAKIEPIEKKIKELKSQIKQPQEIINKVFAREFGFEENLYNDFGKGMTAGTQIAQNRKLRTFETDFNEFSRSSIFRFSTRFHNPPTKELMDFMDNIKTLKVKDIIKETIHRGASPKYDQNGEIPVVKTGHLKNGYIEISEEEFVSEEFYNQKERSQVKENDVLLASTGKVSLGKIDLVETDEKLVVDGHISIIRIDKNKYNPLFFTYFFRSILGFFQIERDYTGATNQIELYASEIEKFLIPDISLTEQERVVNEIKTELDKQKEIEKEIEKERNKIDKIIEEVIK